MESKLLELLTNVEHITNDSRRVKQGSLFLAYPGDRFDGREFIQDAINQGALIIFYEALNFELKKNFSLPVLPVLNLKKQLPTIACKFFKDPSRDLKVIGITGTNGKSTVAGLIDQLLTFLNQASATIGTLGYGTKKEFFELSNTTPDAIKLQEIFHKFKQEKTNYVSMEVSSHAIDQDRISGIHFDTKVLTNVTRDHLDYHHSIENYQKIKGSFFEETTSKKILNIDDEMGISIHKKLKQKENIITYGIKNIKADLNVTRIVIKAMTEISLSYLNKIYSFNFPLWGKHNTYNLLASLGTLLSQNYDLNDIIPHISKLKSIEGRFEVLHKNQKGQPQVIVDYAHTPDALENILKTLKFFKSKSIILIFGCGGDRDQGKRSEMAKVAKLYADFSIVTSDNPRFEDPKKIMKDITDHLESNFIEIENRELAINKGIEIMNEDSILLIAGKGHEKYQDVKGMKSYFSDKDAVLKKIGKKS